MTIEIRQLVIRAVAEARPAAVDAGPHRSSAAPTPTLHAPPPHVHGGVDHESLVAACVREVLRELRKARER